MTSQVVAWLGTAGMAGLTAFVVTLPLGNAAALSGNGS